MSIISEEMESKINRMIILISLFSSQRIILKKLYSFVWLV